MSQLSRVISLDRKNEIIIWTHKGDYWMTDKDPNGWNEYNRSRFEHQYIDDQNLIKNMIFDLDVPTIGAIPGPGYHWDSAILCDVTVASEDCVFDDDHMFMSRLTAIACRGGSLPPIHTGAYEVNEEMLDVLRNRPSGQHASSTAAVIGYDYAKELGIKAYIYDGNTADEMEDLSRISGCPLVPRLSMLIIGFVIAYIFYNHSSLGINFRAVGNNEDVSKILGVKIDSTLILGGIAAGFFFGYAGAVKEAYAGFVEPVSGLASLSTVFQPMAAVLLAMAMSNMINIIIGVPIS